MILFIDDENRYSQNYIEEIKLSGYEVSYHSNIDGAISFFDKKFKIIKLLILDIMMPPGKSFTLEKAEQGLRTGILVYEKVRSKAPLLPVIILTNVTDEKVNEQFLREKNCFYFLKENYLPSELVKEIKKIFK